MMESLRSENPVYLCLSSLSFLSCLFSFLFLFPFSSPSFVLFPLCSYAIVFWNFHVYISYLRIWPCAHQRQNRSFGNLYSGVTLSLVPIKSSISSSEKFTISFLTFDDASFFQVWSLFCLRFVRISCKCASHGCRFSRIG